MREDEARRHLLDLLRNFDDGILVTRGDNGTLHARPMAVADVTDAGDLVFATSRATGKIDEIERDPTACVTFQSGRTFVSVAGDVRLVRDRARIKDLWNPGWKVWFSKGADDPDLVLLEVKARIGEWWDESGSKGMRYLFESAKSLLSGEPARPPEKTNRKVDLT